MGQAISYCASCCPCPFWTKRPHAAGPKSAGGENPNLLSSSRKAQREHTTKKKSAGLRGTPAHLKGLMGDNSQVVRLVLVGSCDTGKTCLLRRFLGGYFDEEGQEEYTKTLGVDFGCKTVELADRRVRLQVWDTGGSETYRSVVSHYLRSSDGIVLCFDINRKATLQDLKSTWAPYLDRHTPEDCRVLLVGNKGDYRDHGREEVREVPHAEAKRLADAMGAQFFETSAKTGANVDLAVLALMREVLHHRDYSAKKITVAVDKKEGGSKTQRERMRLSVALQGAMTEASSEEVVNSRRRQRKKENGPVEDTESPQTSTSSSDETAGFEGVAPSCSSPASCDDVNNNNNDDDEEKGETRRRTWRSSTFGSKKCTDGADSGYQKCDGGDGDGGFRGSGCSTRSGCCAVGGKEGNGVQSRQNIARGSRVVKIASNKGGQESSSREKNNGPGLVRQLSIARSGGKSSSSSSNSSSSSSHHQAGHGELSSYVDEGGNSSRSPRRNEAPAPTNGTALSKPITISPPAVGKVSERSPVIVLEKYHSPPSAPAVAAVRELVTQGGERQTKMDLVNISPADAGFGWHGTAPPSKASRASPFLLPAPPVRSRQQLSI